MTIVYIGGEQGSGKTTILTYFGESYRQQGYNLYANYPLKLPFTPIHDLDELKAYIKSPKPMSGILLGDEWYVWMDSRGSMTEQNKATSYLIQHTRKKQLDFFWTSHLFGSVDIRVRKLTDALLMPKMIYAESGQVFCNVKVYLRVKENPLDINQEPRYTYSHDFSILANPVFKWFDTASGVFDPVPEEKVTKKKKVEIPV